MKSLHLVVSCVLATALLATVPACTASFATRSDRGEYRSAGQRRAYATGYDSGVGKGRDDGRDGKRPDYEQESAYRDGDHGYKQSDGDRELYRDAFRKGFTSGYNEAYQENTRPRR